MIAVLLVGIAHAGQQERDSKHGISMHVPDGFHSFPAGMSQPGTIFSFSRGELGAPGFELIGVTALGGTIGRESFDPTPIVKGMASTLGLTLDRSARRPMHWKGFELDAFTATMRQDDLVATLAGVQIPVKGEAVQLIMMRLGEQDIGDELQAVLATFEAESNWLTTEARIQKLVVGGATLLATIGLGTFLWLRRRRRRRSGG